ncbi:TPM domain-containing protein [Macrococcus sp. EM39E]|uniref:TPM domain-containing protein n=1 Tax=Macrococcus animalis TaxID=3395467 RepID=UPI0039BE1B85
MVSKGIKIVMIIIVLFTLTSRPVYAFGDLESLPKLNEEHLNFLDLARVFSEDELLSLSREASQIPFSIDIMLVTEKEMNEPISVRANRMFEGYGLNKEYRNGMIILFNQQEGKVVVKTDKQIGAYFTEKKLKEMIESATNQAFNKEEYDIGLTTLYNSIKADLPNAKKYIDTHKIKYVKNEEINQQTSIPILDNWLIFGLISGFVMMGLAFIVTLIRK